MSPETSSQNSLPHDLAFKIVSSLQVSDVCSLGSCSRFWRELCGSDCVWEALCQHRWPGLVLDHDYSASLEGWRELYIAKHAEMARKADIVVDYLKRCLSCESIEGGFYLKAIEDMCLMQFGFQDVQMFLFKPKLNVLFNLVGLHYCIMHLDVPAERITEALQKSRILHRQVCVRWWKLGRLFYGFRLRDEAHTRNISLEGLATAKETEVLAVLHRGVIHEVLRISVSVPEPTCAQWY